MIEGRVNGSDEKVPSADEVCSLDRRRTGGHDTMDGDVIVADDRTVQY